jgi:hypothetical protein
MQKMHLKLLLESEISKLVSESQISLGISVGFSSLLKGLTFFDLLNTSGMKQPSWCSISRLALSQTERRKYKATVDPASEDNPSAVLSTSYTVSSCSYTGHSGHLYSQLDSWVSRQYFVLSLLECWYKSEKLSHYFSFLTPTDSGRGCYIILFAFQNHSFIMKLVTFITLLWGSLVLGQSTLPPAVALYERQLSDWHALFSRLPRSRGTIPSYHHTDYS